MRQLPTEIIHQIMLLLNQEQKVECMRACQSWERSIKKLSLFDTVRVSSREALERLVKKVTREPQQGSKVQRLIIDVLIDTSFDMAVLPTLFPNLRFLYVWGWEVSQQSEMFLDPWQKQLEFVGEQRGSSFTRRLLMDGVCTQLKTLCLTLHQDQGNDLALYANAPNITTLILSSFKFTLDDLETLHQNLPRLETLKLKYGSLIESDFQGFEIEPATCLRALSAFQLLVGQPAAYLKFIQYIRRKYIKITDLSLHCSWTEEYEQAIGGILTQGWHPLFFQLGSQLSTLRLDPDRLSSDIFYILDNADCHIKHLHLSEACLRSTKESLKRSNQRHCIESIVLDFQGRGVSGFHWLKHLSKLRSLKVIFSFIPKEDKLINDLLDSFPNTVESLAIENNKLNFDFTTLRHYSIKRLELTNVTLPSGMDTFISLHFPNLNRLKLEGCEYFGDFFVLQNINLHYLDIISRIPADKRLVMVKTLADQKGYLYKPKHKVNYYGVFRERLNIHDATLCPSVRATSMDKAKTKTKPFLTIVCNSIRNLTIIDKQ